MATKFQLDWEYGNSNGNENDGYLTYAKTSISNNRTYLGGNQGALGTPLSWYSMHSRYIIDKKHYMDLSINSGGLDGKPSAVIPHKSSNLFQLTAPDTDNNIMIWKKSSDPTKYSSIDNNIIWDFSDSPSNITIYEASYVGIDSLLTKGSTIPSLTTKVNKNTSNISDLSTVVYTNKSNISDLSTVVYTNKSNISDLSKIVYTNQSHINDVSSDVYKNTSKIADMLSKITTIENFLGGMNPPDNNGKAKITNYYLGLSGENPGRKKAWSDISTNSIWRQFI